MLTQQRKWGLERLNDKNTYLNHVPFVFKSESVCLTPFSNGETSSRCVLGLIGNLSEKPISPRFYWESFLLGVVTEPGNLRKTESLNSRSLKMWVGFICEHEMRYFLKEDKQHCVIGIEVVQYLINRQLLKTWVTQKYTSVKSSKD